MPSSSKKQHNFMAAIANSPSFAKKVGVPQSVGKDFNEADKGRKFSKGGDTMASKMNPGFMAMMAKKKDGKAEGGKADMKQDKSMMQKAVNKHEGRLHKGASMTKLAKGGGIETKGKTKGKMIAMKNGGRC
jgi:hypothetical protein